MTRRPLPLIKSDSCELEDLDSAELDQDEVYECPPGNAVSFDASFPEPGRVTLELSEREGDVRNIDVLEKLVGTHDIRRLSEVYDRAYGR